MCGRDADDESLAIDVFGADAVALRQAESALIHDGEEGAVSAIAKGAQKEVDFLAGEDVRKRFFASDFDLGPDLPAEVEVVSVEGAQGAEGLIYGAALEVELGLEMEEEVEDGAAF